MSHSSLAPSASLPSPASPLEADSSGHRLMELEATLDAVDRSQAVIEFQMDGTILLANENFLSTMGYSLDEIRGRHHRMFVDAEFGQSAEYADFWARLGRGSFESQEYKRYAKGGREVWIQASYNPILDEGGKPYKVVKIAADITEQKVAEIELREKVDVMLAVVHAAAEGDLTQEVTVCGDDAIGQMGKGLARFLEGLREKLKGISSHVGLLATASESLASVSQQIRASADETSTQAQVVATASRSVSSNVQTVASGTEEMTATISEISQISTKAAKAASQGVQTSEETSRIVEKLGESSTEIGQVVKVITSIAQQTNLLALNATIEAARAGEAGKGFAVVANEVKELAKETAGATEDIGKKIEAIQADTTESVEAIGSVSEAIDRISNLQGTVASAVEEQGATTAEMARNVTDANRGTEEIAQSIAGVAEAASTLSDGAATLNTSAEELATMASSIRGVVEEFRL